MSKMAIAFLVTVVCVSVSSCARTSNTEIEKVVDFELSPDEERIVFCGVTPIGNTDIWVVDTNGTNLRKLTFKDRSPSNHIARFFQKHKWRNFFVVDMLFPKWTEDGRILFCQRLTKYDMWGEHIVSLRYWTINPDGNGKRPKTEEDIVVRRKPFDPIHSFEISDYSEKHKKEILLKDGILWVHNSGESSPKRLIQ